MAGFDFFDTKECAWKDCSVYVNGKYLKKIRGIKYKAMAEKEHLHGAGDEPIEFHRPVAGGSRDGQVGGYVWSSYKD